MKKKNKLLQKTYEYLDNALLKLWQTLYEKGKKIQICNKEQYPTNHFIFVFNLCIKIDGKCDPVLF